MNRIGVREFQQGWRKLDTPVEVYNRDTHVGTWIPAGEKVVGWLDPDYEANLDQISGVEMAKNRQKARDALLNAAFSRKTDRKR